MFPRFLAVCSFFCAAAASAQHLGETHEAVVARNGAPIEANHAKGTAVYRRGPWKIDVTYTDGVARQLKVTKLDSLAEEEVQSILDENAEAATWSELRVPGTTRMWQRSDLATARCDRVKPRAIELRDSPFPKAPPVARAATMGGGGLLRATLPAPQAAAAKAVVPRPSLGTQSLLSAPRGRRAAFPSSENVLTGLVVRILAACLVLGGPILAVAFFFKVLLPLLLKRGVKSVNDSVVKEKHPPGAAPSLNRPAPPPLPRTSPPEIVREVEDSIPALENIVWDNFELLAGEIFRRQDYAVEITSGLGSDGGKDLTLRKDGETVLVQCKCFAAGNKVPVAAMREFFGLIVAEGAQRGIFMTTGLYSRDALDFAEGKPIELLGRSEIEDLMTSVARPAENLCDVRSWIDDFAAGVRVTDPTCPRCRGTMKLRRGVTGRAFWGCSFFPRCRGKRDARVALVRAFSYQSS